MVSSVTVEQRERARLLRIVREYESAGYEVFIQPDLEDRPSFLQNFQPDVIARGPTENVVIEVKSQPSLKKSGYLEKLASVVQKYEGWRLELVLTNPRDLQKTAEQWHLMTIPEIRRRLNQIKNLAAQPNHAQDAMLLLWTIGEATLTHLAQRDSYQVSSRSSRSLVKKLFSLGLLSEQEFDVLDQAAMARNRIAHGYISHESLDLLFQSTERVIIQLIDSIVDPKQES